MDTASDPCPGSHRFAAVLALATGHRWAGPWESTRAGSPVRMFRGLRRGLRRRHRNGGGQPIRPFFGVASGCGQPASTATAATPAAADQACGAQAAG